MQVARAHTPTLIPEPEPEPVPVPELVPVLEPVLEPGPVLVLVPVPVLLVLVPAPPPLVGLVQVAATQRLAWAPLLVRETPALVPDVPWAVQVPRAHTPTWTPPPPPLVLVLGVVVWAAATAAGGGLVPGGDSAAWAAVWLSRNIPLAPAARMRPRWMMFMTGGSLHR